VLITFVSQDDKDLVHEFVNSDGLSALISVGQDADQNYQNYILRGREITSQFIAEFIPACNPNGINQQENLKISYVSWAHRHQANKMCQVLPKIPSVSIKFLVGNSVQNQQFI